VAKRKNRCPCRKSNPVRQSRSLVTILTELSRLPVFYSVFLICKFGVIIIVKVKCRGTVLPRTFCYKFRLHVVVIV
jgi:hypothetical protein